MYTAGQGVDARLTSALPTGHALDSSGGSSDSGGKSPLLEVSALAVLAITLTREASCIAILLSWGEGVLLRVGSSTLVLPIQGHC